MMVPARCGQEVTAPDGLVGAGLFVYLGQVEQKSDGAAGTSCYNVRHVTLQKGETVATKAAQLRRLSEQELRDVFQIRSFGSFPDHTLFTCEAIERVTFGTQTSKKHRGQRR